MEKLRAALAGEALTAVLRPELERNGSVEGAGRLELALGGAIGGLVQGGAAGALEWLGKGAGKANSGSAGSSSASGFKGKRDFPRRLGVLSSQRCARSG
jgi:hypothetical protein